MKKFLIGLLLAGEALAGADYICQVRNYRIDLDLHQNTSTHFWLTDTISHETLTQGYAGFIEKKGAKVNYLFYVGQPSPVKMTFNHQDTIDLPEKIDMSIDAKIRGLLIWDKVTCSKK